MLLFMCKRSIKQPAQHAAQDGALLLTAACNHDADFLTLVLWVIMQSRSSWTHANIDITGFATPNQIIMSEVAAFMSVCASLKFRGRQTAWICIFKDLHWSACLNIQIYMGDEIHVETYKKGWHMCGSTGWLENIYTREIFQMWTHTFPHVCSPMKVQLARNLVDPLKCMAPCVEITGKLCKCGNLQVCGPAWTCRFTHLQV